MDITRLRRALPSAMVVSLALLAPSCGGGSGGSDAPVVLTSIFVGNEGTGNVTRLDPTGAASPFFAGGGGSAPFTMTGLAYNPANHTLYSARNSNGFSSDGNVYRYDSAGVQTTFATLRHDATPLNAIALAVSPSGVLHALCLGPNVIERFDSAGTATLVHDCATSSQAFGICFSPQGDLYYSDFDNGQVFLVTSVSTRVTMADGAAGIAEPTAVACDSVGRLFIACRSQDKVWRFDAPGLGYEFVNSTHGVTDCFAMAIDNEDNLWVVNYGPPSLTKIDAAGIPVGTVPFADSSDGLGLPRSIALKHGP